jgi:hypothetical protein
MMNASWFWLDAMATRMMVPYKTLAKPVAPGGERDS